MFFIQLLYYYKILSLCTSIISYNDIMYIDMWSITIIVVKRSVGKFNFGFFTIIIKHLVHISILVFGLTLKKNDSRCMKFKLDVLY